jgi:inner membrane protein
VALGPTRVPTALAAVGCAASVLPDVDSLGFAAGIPYGHTFGHRGFTHSLFFAACVGVSPVAAFAFVFSSVASHGLLDAMTTGGLGVAFWSPFSNERYFLPWRVILVSPIGVEPFFSRRGLEVVKSELTWIWAPSTVLALIGSLLRK